MVYLDLSHLNPDRVRAHFPRIYKTCLQYKIDITCDMIPIRPAAHYSMGGVRTDLEGRASLPGLYAAGEAAATGVHGANRLASNSLLEGLVFGARAGSMMRSELGKSAKRGKAASAMASNGPLDDVTEQAIRNIQDLMWNDVGIVRSAEGLKRAIEKLQAIAPGAAHPPSRRAWEAQSLGTTGLLVAQSALARDESRGAHYRTDFPAHNDAQFQKHSVVKDGAIRFA
jgi:L-aspartate oxidase